MNIEAKGKEWCKGSGDINKKDLPDIIAECIKDLMPAIQDDWVSVDDRLPDQFEIVMIYPQPEYMGTIYEGEYNGKKWTASFEDTYQTSEQTVNVTHWKPITEPK